MLSKMLERWMGSRNLDARVVYRVDTLLGMRDAVKAGLGVAALSYCGKVHFDWVADWDLVPDVERLAQGMAPAFDELRSAAMRRNGSRPAPPL